MVNKSATYREPRYMCRGSTKWCVYMLKINSLQNMLGSGRLSHHVFICMYIRSYEMHRTARYWESTRCVLWIWRCRFGWFYDVCAVSHGVCCGYMVNKSATYREPRYMCRGSTKWCVHMLKIKSLQNMLGSGRYHITFLSGMYIGVMRCTELQYIESPRDVCWGSGTLTDFMMFAPFPIVYAVGGWWAKTATCRDPKYMCRGSAKCYV